MTGGKIIQINQQYQNGEPAGWKAEVPEGLSEDDLAHAFVALFAAVPEDINVMSFQMKMVGAMRSLGDPSPPG